MTRTLNDLQVDVESTFVLLDLVRAGDARALDRLFSRYVNPLRRFAHGRLPAASRDMLDTNDLVQDTLVASLKHIDAFQPQREGALLAYLRQAVVNRVRDEARRKARRPCPRHSMNRSKEPTHHRSTSPSGERQQTATRRRCSG
jgi:RNA polymerase sigma factor (sigma-70 family)